MLLPFLISFVDISLRSVLKEHLSADVMLFVSFAGLLFMYTLGYYFLWKSFSRRKEIEQTKLVELGTLSIIFSDLIIYASLYQAGNTLSNFTWLGFYLLIIALFYLLGKRTVNHSQTNKTV